MKKIRNGVFETNSSSMHSICINNGDTGNPFPDYEFYVNKDGTIKIYNKLYFGRYPFEFLATVYDKTRYAIASYGEERFEEIQDIFADAYNAINRETYFSEFDMPKTTWDWRTGKDLDTPVVEYGNIDHQSYGLLDRFLKKYKVTLKEFITNPKYVVVIDGDEYCAFQKYKDLGLLPTLEVVE